MNETVKCPYCKEYTEINAFEQEHYEDYCEYQCEYCSKNFEVYAEPTTKYSVVGKADCLNGSKHIWIPLVGSPEIWFRGKYRCRDCSKEMEVKSELATKEEIKKDLEG